MARELIILPRFKRDYRNARKHAEFDVETLEYKDNGFEFWNCVNQYLEDHNCGPGETPLPSRQPAVPRARAAHTTNTILIVAKQYQHGIGSFWHYWPGSTA